MDAGTSPISYCFERIEKKFWMSREQYEALKPLLQAHTTPDVHGEATVCNIYYDTPDYLLIRRSIERPLFKEKLRVRSYGVPSENDMVFVELKRKLNGIGYKRRIYVPFYKAKRLLRGEAISCDNPQIEREILNFVHRYHPRPMVYLTYQRIAMYANEDSSLRLTIDQDLSYRIDQVDHPSLERMQPILSDPTKVLLEIKASGSIPSWLTEALSRQKIYQAPFSKVGTCYTYHIAPAISNQKIG
jgi:SPX domain protein involved in polyphosphate accumulation